MSHPFKLDPFQEEAIQWITKNHSVLVSAPTGAGKTVIAEAAVEKAFEKNEKAIYTAPIKALSNQKYRDFRARFGDDRVGILTGDVSINPDADIVVMTTEIYRNSLFDMSDRIEKIGWVIFDEVHYLDDPQRGTVWEEALLFTPEHIRILALSATAPNILDLCKWIKSIHKREIEIVQSSHRPVPLDFVFQCQNKFFTDTKLLRKHGYLHRDNWRVTSRERRRGIRPMRAKKNRHDHLFKSLITKDYFPAIYFAFGRKKTEQLAWDALEFDFVGPKKGAELLKKFKNLLKKYDLEHEKSAQDLFPLLEQGIAYHHAGMLPSLKEVIEQLFTERLIKLIFTTETFALGINMPARCVILDELEKYYGDGFKYLTTRDFYQMAGRAGRRGLDTKGTVYARIEPHYVPYPEMKRIIFGKPESISSQLNAAYATLLNLYKTLGEKLFDIYPQTFHYFQSTKKQRAGGLKMLQSKVELLEEMEYLVRPEKKGATSGWGLTAKGEFGASLFGYELILAELHHHGELERFDETELSILVSGLIYEPRKGDKNPRLKGRKESIRKTAEHYARGIHRKEFKHKIFPYTKPPHFQMSNMIEAWMAGATFDEIMEKSSADEGGIVRHFRMVIQLLREILHAPHISNVLRTRAKNAFDLINRDVIDAEKQLRI